MLNAGMVPIALIRAPCCLRPLEPPPFPPYGSHQYAITPLYIEDVSEFVPDQALYDNLRPVLIALDYILVTRGRTLIFVE